MSLKALISYSQRKVEAELERDYEMLLEKGDEGR